MACSIIRLVNTSLVVDEIIAGHLLIVISVHPAQPVNNGFYRVGMTLFIFFPGDVTAADLDTAILDHGLEMPVTQGNIGIEGFTILRGQWERRV